MAELNIESDMLHLRKMFDADINAALNIVTNSNFKVYIPIYFQRKLKFIKFDFGLISGGEVLLLKQADGR